MRIGTGESWYGMDGADGDPMGYARLGIGKRADGAFDVDWELHLVWQGSTYEESRTSVFDADGRMVAAGYSAGGHEVAAERDGDRMRGTRDGEPFEVAIPADGVAGMGFVLAASLEMRPGAELSCNDLNEADGFKDGGRLTFTVGEEQTPDLPAGPTVCHRVSMRSEGGRELAMWVDGNRELVQADWGGGTLMKRHAEPTRELFRPPPPAFVEADPENAAWLKLSGEFAGIEPETMFAHWTEPELLCRWWPQHAEVEARPGGRYHLGWKEPDWFLRGEVVAFEPGRRFAFTWRWDHQPDGPVREVRLEFAPAGDGTRLRLEHGPYGDGGKERSARADHLRGWLALGPRLARCNPGA